MQTSVKLVINLYNYVLFLNGALFQLIHIVPLGGSTGRVSAIPPLSP